MPKTIAFQGAHGAYSDMACRAVFPDAKTLPCHSFPDAFQALIGGDVDLAMIPVDNTLAGRVADVHHLISGGDLFIIGEHFQPIHHCLLGVKGTSVDELKIVHSHIHALPQCRKLIKELNLDARVHADTAGAAEFIAAQGDAQHGAIASALAADIYGLEILRENVQDAHHNTTRFLTLATEPEIPVYNKHENTPTITSLVFEVRNIPAALYKCLGGFATNGLSLSKLESYVGEQFQAARFYCDVDGHLESESFKLALEELGFYAKNVTFIGSYPAHEFRARL